MGTVPKKVNGPNLASFRWRPESNVFHILAMNLIFVTSATDDNTLSRAFDAGGNDYIRKPVNRIELVKCVEAAFVQETLANKNKEEETLRSVLSMSETICYEINQPLQYISGISQLLLMDLEKGSKAYEKVTKMKTQIDRMGEITKKLMQINRVDAVSYLGDTDLIHRQIGKTTQPAPRGRKWQVKWRRNSGCQTIR